MWTCSFSFSALSSGHIKFVFCEHAAFLFIIDWWIFWNVKSIICHLFSPHSYKRICLLELWRRPSKRKEVQRLWCLPKLPPSLTFSPPIRILFLSKAHLNPVNLTIFLQFTTLSPFIIPLITSFLRQNYGFPQNLFNLCEFKETNN